MMQFEYFNDRRWFDGSGNECTFAEVLKHVGHSQDKELHIGTDSHASNEAWIFASAVCIYQRGKGGKYFFFRDKKSKGMVPSLKARLHHEVEVSIMLGSVIREQSGRDEITIHADTSTNPINKSFASTSSLRNFVVAMGFRCRTKPEAWAAAGVADKHSK